MGRNCNKSELLAEQTLVKIISFTEVFPYFSNPSLHDVFALIATVTKTNPDKLAIINQA
jgi:hypothetical protein